MGLTLANGQNSFNCSEESCNNPFADNYFNLQSIYSLCSEETGNMVFQKGNIAWNKGIPHSEETKEIIRQKTLVQMRTKGNPNKGRKWSDETKLKMSKARLGRFNKETNPFFGHRYTNETKKKMSDAKRGITPKKAWKKGDCVGAKNPQWIDGRSFEPYCPKFNKELKEHIRERDNRTCQLCGVKENGRKLDVHHIHYDKENCEPDLMALCHDCHVKVGHNRDYWEQKFINMLLKRDLLGVISSTP